MVEKLAQKKLDTFSDFTVLLSPTSPSPKQFKGDPQNLVVEENNIELEDLAMSRPAQETLIETKVMPREKTIMMKDKKLNIPYKKPASV